MKLETVVVYAKLICVFAGTSLLTLQTGLSQWSNEPTNPSAVQWIMIIGGSIGTGLTATGAFLSNAFGSYFKGEIDRRNLRDNLSGVLPSSKITPVPVVPIKLQSEPLNNLMTGDAHGNSAPASGVVCLKNNDKHGVIV